jgi:hypothetical protein
MRIAIALGVVLTVCFSTVPAAADPLSVPFVKFAGSGGDQAGIVGPAGDVNGDGHGDVIIGAPTASDESDAGGAAYVVFGPFTAGTTIDLRRLGQRGLVLRGSERLPVGTSVGAAGDVNGDDLDDLVVGGSSGHAYVVFGRRRPQTITLNHLGHSGITLRGEPLRPKRYKWLSDQFGRVIGPVGDINGDGLADVGVVAQGDSGEIHGGYATRPGSAYVVFGRRSGGTISMTRLGRAGVRVGFPSTTGGVTARPRRGASITGIGAAGDWNADGRPDIVVSGYDHVPKVWIVYGQRRSGKITLSRLKENGFVTRGPGGTHGPWLGGVTGGKDVDGDDRPDLVVGTPETHSDSTGFIGHSGGGVWLIRGSRSRLPLDLSPGPRVWELARGEPEPYLGGTAYAGGGTALGLVNGDGLADILTTAGSGIAVVYGTTSRTTARIAALSPAEGYFIRATDEGGLLNVATAGDLNGDGRTDILAGAPAARGIDGGMWAGAAYLIFSP